MFADPNGDEPSEQAKIRRFGLCVTISTIAITLTIHQVSMAVVARDVGTIR